MLALLTLLSRSVRANLSFPLASFANPVLPLFSARPYRLRKWNVISKPRRIFRSTVTSFYHGAHVATHAPTWHHICHDRVDWLLGLGPTESTNCCHRIRMNATFISQHLADPSCAPELQLMSTRPLSRLPLIDKLQPIGANSNRSMQCPPPET